MMSDLHEILAQFDIPSNAAMTIEPFGNGHINRTYLVGTEPKTVLQYVNSTVFPRPIEVMENIAGITEFLSRRITAEGGDPTRETIRLIPARDGRYYVEADGSVYRLFYLVDGHSIELADDPNNLYLAAKTFGRFLKLLEGYPVETLHETIRDFHNTADRYRKFRAAVDADVAHRATEVQKEIAFVTERADDCRVVTDAIAAGEIPLRVTHNDTKLNNFLFDESGACIALLDLDTVMPGSLLYDYGDALRFGASSAAEDETDLDKVYCRTECVDAFTRGFLEEFGEVLTPKEKALLPFSIKLLTLECGMRFLTDYLSGDTYFHIAHPRHNLDRARNQFKLVWDLEQKYGLAPGSIR